MAGVVWKELEFQDAVLHALDIPRRTEQLEVFNTMLEAEDYFTAGSMLGDEAAHLKKLSKMVLKWDKLLRKETG